MKVITPDEIEALNRIREDVSITINDKFTDFEESVKTNLTSLISIFVGLYFRSLNHDPKNPGWRNADYVFSTNNYTNIVKNIVKVHAGYEDFNKLESFLKRNTFPVSENTFGDAIGYYVVDRDLPDQHQRFYYVIVSDLDLLNNMSALEFIIKNNMRRIIIIAYTKKEQEIINKENKLNGRLINLGFDTLVINGTSPSNICDAINYAKRLNKPSLILANIN